MTTAWTREGQVAVFIAVDHHNAECVGIHAARHGTRFEALEPIRLIKGNQSQESTPKPKPSRTVAVSPTAC